MRLERIHGLDVKNPTHVWLLHALFLDAINTDCMEFQEQWNSHPISGSNNKSPDVCILSILNGGVPDFY